MPRALAATLLATAFLVAAVPAQGQKPSSGKDGSSVIGRSATVYRSLSNLRADFVQVIDNPMLDSATSRGKLLQAGADKFAMRFSEPSGDAIVIDGEHVWIYTPSTTPGQAIRLAMPSGGPVYGYNIIAWLLDHPADRYQATLLRSERVGNRMTDVVELIPTVPDLPFTRAVVWLDREDALPRRLEVAEKHGGTRSLTLTNVRTNGEVPAKAFKLDLPPNTRIVDQ
jgi:outer membrane lipoprotein-sorting protein